MHVMNVTIYMAFSLYFYPTTRLLPLNPSSNIHQNLNEFFFKFTVQVTKCASMRPTLTKIRLKISYLLPLDYTLKCGILNLHAYK